MAKNNNLTDFLKDLADGIRYVDGVAGDINPQDFRGRMEGWKVDRADTSMATTANDANDTLTITASNDQPTGYVVGANKTATTTITLTANGANVTASDGTKSIRTSVVTVERANTIIDTWPDDDKGDTLIIEAINNQGTGYVEGSNSTARVVISQSVNGNRVSATDGEYTIYKDVAKVERASTSIDIQADSDKSRLTFTAYNNQGTGYVEQKDPANTATAFAILSIDTPTIDDFGDITSTAYMQDQDYNIGVSKKSEKLSLGIGELSDSKGAYVDGTCICVEPNVTKGYVKQAIQDKWSYDVTQLEPNLASKVKKGETVFGVDGEYEGGTSIATCNVTVKFTTNAGNCLTSATTFANGAVSVFNSSTKSGEFTISNVICGSALSINTQNVVSLYTSASQQPHNTLLGGTVKVPATAGQTYTIEVGVVDD